MRAKYMLFGTIAFAFGVIGAIYMTPAVTAEVSDSIPMYLGHVEMMVTDANGNLKHYQQTDNVVTNKGLECAIKNLFGTGTTTGTPLCTVPSTTATFNNIALGDDGTTALVAQTGLIGNEVARDPADSADWSVANEQLTLVLACVTGTDCGLANGETVAETGLFDSPTDGAGNMFARQGLNSITVVTGDTVTITWTITGVNS